MMDIRNVPARRCNARDKWKAFFNCRPCTRARAHMLRYLEKIYDRCARLDAGIEEAAGAHTVTRQSRIELTVVRFFFTFNLDEVSNK